MKLFTRLGLFKAKNVVLNPKTLDAYSYGWWRFVAVVEGKVVFNSYRYSISTAKHQRKVAAVLHDLGVHIDLDLQLPRGIRHDQTLAELIVEAEETLCEQFLEAEVKRDKRNAKARIARLTAKLTDHLENYYAFRDYDIVDRDLFGNANSTIATKCAVHQCVDVETLERDVENALHSFRRDGFGSIVFYVGGA